LKRLPGMDPSPPSPRTLVPWAKSGFAVLRDPSAFFSRCRLDLGDTFRIDVFGHRLLCFFSPQGVHELWALPEREASKGLADFALLRHKVPVELFAGRRTRPHDLFSGDDVAHYLRHCERVVARELGMLGDSAEVELFAFTRRFSHRVGLASWGGLTGAIGDESQRVLDPLIRSLDQLDAAESFVHPQRAFRTWATRKRAERRALARLENLFGEIVAQRDRRGQAENDLFDRICERWRDVDGDLRVQGIARDVVLVHMGAQSNLFAAAAWTLVHLIERPALLARVRDGDVALIDRCAHESIRLRQRSIVLRRVLRPLQIGDENVRYDVEPGILLATMMSVTNTTAAPGLADFDPDHYRAGPRFAGRDELPTRELVTTFGHGPRTCPAMHFSIAAIRSLTQSLVAGFDLEPRFRDPQPLRRQIGGVARADRPCRVRVRRRSA